jgi:hypothetical protein
MRLRVGVPRILPGGGGHPQFRVGGNFRHPSRRVLERLVRRSSARVEDSQQAVSAFAEVRTPKLTGLASPLNNL